MVQGGISLLSMTAADAEDPQTLRMVSGAIANLCGNGKLLVLLHHASVSFLFIYFWPLLTLQEGSVCCKIEAMERLLDLHQDSSARMKI